jgi:Cu(I)/Ag(I) efflux system protein CusF
MKYSTRIALVVALALGTGGVLAQQKMDDMPMKDMPMKDMPMKDMPMGGPSQDQSHQASGTVKKIDAAKGTVTFAHGPVSSLDWPAMTMGFRVKDKALLERLAVGKEVVFEFVKEGADYVVTEVR